MRLCYHIHTIKLLINTSLMESIKLNISELDEFTDIMSLTNEEWLYRFKKWFKHIVRTYCKYNCLMLVACDDEPQNYCKMPIDDLTQALYENYYAEIFRLMSYKSDKIQNWNESLEKYAQAKAQHETLRRKGVTYMLLHIKEAMNTCSNLKKNDVELTMVDVAEVALNRYVSEGRGDFLTFSEFMN